MEKYSDLQILREGIDEIDAELIALLARRFALTRQVGQYKKHHALQPTDTNREEIQLARVRQLAAESGLEPTFAEQILRFIISKVVEDHQCLQL